MASNTNNLGLLKKDPVADGNDTFNIRTMLNENWDKIDEFAGKTTPISKGGTGATTAAQALANLGGIAAGAVGNLHVWQSVQSGVTDYLTSTDRNAYPDNVTDAQDAYYTLGDVVTGSFKMSDLYPRNAYLYKYANSVAVEENGDVALQNPEAVSFNYDSNIGYESTVLSLIAGKFLYYYGRDSMAADSSAPDTQPPFNATPSEIIYVPVDAVITSTTTYPGGFYLDKYQPVTGYPAIPANTAITYLGQLGGGVRIEVGSYVGTGTYGQSNPNSLTFGFEPKIVIIYCVDSFNMAIFSKNSKKYSVTSSGRGICEFKNSGKTLEYYYPHNSPDSQLNYSDFEYHYIAIG